MCHKNIGNLLCRVHFSDWISRRSFIGLLPTVAKMQQQEIFREFHRNSQRIPMFRFLREFRCSDFPTNSNVRISPRIPMFGFLRWNLKEKVYWSPPNCCQNVHNGTIATRPVGRLALFLTRHNCWADVRRVRENGKTFKRHFHRSGSWSGWKGGSPTSFESFYLGGCLKFFVFAKEFNLLLLFWELIFNLGTPHQGFSKPPPRKNFPVISAYSP